MMLLVKYFGAIAEVTQKKEEQFYILDETSSLLSIKEKLEAQYPQIKNIPYTFALNQVMVGDEAMIKEHDILALLPPFAGG